MRRMSSLGVIVFLFVAVPAFAEIEMVANPTQARIGPSSPVATVTVAFPSPPPNAWAADIYVAGTPEFMRENFIARIEFDDKPSTMIPIAIGGRHRFKAVVFDREGTLIAESNLVTVTIDADFKTRDNGITVGRVKQFDDRALATMLRDVETALANQRFLSFTGVSEAVGRFQGATAERSFVGFSATGPGTPAIEETIGSKDTTASPTSTTEVTTDATGATSKVTDTIGTAGTEDTTSRKVTQTAVTAIPPQVPTAGTGAFTLQPTFSVSAQDLLAEHTELAYQAINLRLLLQRALTDRLFMTEQGAEVRTQPVIGFNVSLDPRPRFQDAVAEVIISAVGFKGTLGREAPELVALLPKEKTYNVATITNRTRTMSLGAVVQLVNVGLTASGSRETYFIVKDTDTVALEKVPVKEARSEPPQTLDFAWQFRPVLDRRMVAPGSRQVFAVLALPARPDETWDGVLQIRTRWRAYDRKTKSAGWVILGSESWQPPYRVTVLSADKQGNATAARIRDIQWQDNGAGKAVLTVEGIFPAQTRVAVADTFVDRPETGLLLQTDRQVIAAVPFDKLFLAPAVLIDSFGIPTMLRHPNANPEQRLELQVPDVAAAGEKTTVKIDVYVAARPPQNPDAVAAAFDAANADPGILVHRTPPTNTTDGRPVTLNEPVVLIGNRTFSVRNAGLKMTPGEIKNEKQTKAITLEVVDADVAFLKEAGRLKVLDLFYGNGQAAEAPIKFAGSDVPVITELQILSFDASNVTLGLVGQNLTSAKELKVTVGDKTIDLTPEKKTLVAFTVSAANAERARRAVVQRKDAEPKLLAIPPVPVDDLKIVHDRIREGEVRRLRMQGPHLAQVSEIFYNGLKLDFTRDSRDARTIYLHHSAELMGSSGEKELQLVSGNGAMNTLRVFIDAKPKE
jgi:hypothetical protein